MNSRCILQFAIKKCRCFRAGCIQVTFSTKLEENMAKIICFPRIFFEPLEPTPIKNTYFSMNIPFFQPA